MVEVALFASGNGSNVESIHKYIISRKLDNPNRKDSIRIKMVFINNEKSYVINRCEELNIPYTIIDNNFINNKLLSSLKELKIDFIALCGFLKLIPHDVCDEYEKRIINIHPSLLPKYGGKGMYGMNVHRQVIKNKEKYTGISIHYVNGDYDRGEIILKVRNKINKNDTPEIISNKIKKIEHKWYPITIYSLISRFNF